MARHEWDAVTSADPHARRFLVLAIVLAVVGFGLAWAALHWAQANTPFYGAHVSSDVSFYSDTAAGMAAGQVPYRDFEEVYPPGAIPFFVLPWLLGGSSGPEAYQAAFEVALLACGVAWTVLAPLVAARLGASRAGIAFVAAFTALSPLLIGQVIQYRYDLWPAALTLAAVAASVTGRRRTGAVLLGIGAAAKVYPAFLVPLLAIEAWRRAGRREAVVVMGFAAGTTLLFLAPFLVLAPAGVISTATDQASRPLQVESIAGSLLLVLHVTAGLATSVVHTFHSDNLDGHRAAVLATAQSVAQAASLLGLWAWYARGDPGGRRFVTAAAALTVAYVAFGKILSPQYLIWLIPLVPLVRGGRGVVASVLLALALLVTAAYFPARYDELLIEAPGWMPAIVLGRDLLLLAALVVLVVPAAWLRGIPQTLTRSSSRTR
jgi:hypothetical protein